MRSTGLAQALVMYGPDALPSDIKSKCAVPVYTFKDFLALGRTFPTPI
jgi:hypothetical protein